MATAIETYVDELLDGLDIGGREHELRTDLNNAINGIANRVDDGYHFDVRVGPDIDEEDQEGASDDGQREERNAAEQIRRTAPTLRFINPAGQRILSLPEGNSVNDEDKGTGPGGSPSP